MPASARSLIISAIALTAAVAPLRAQPAAAVRPSRTFVGNVPARRPFAVGEQFSYDVKYGPMRVGRGSISLVSTDTVRGQPAWRAVVRVKGGAALYSLDNTSESWIDTNSLTSLRVVNDVRERGKKRHREFEIYAERGVYTEAGKDERPTVAEPLDEASFFYFVRTLPLADGDTYSLDRYFKSDRNPVTIRVARRERVKVPAGTFDAVVIRPTIKSSGMLGASHRTEVWISDDERRLLLQVRSDLPLGSVTMRLREYRAGSAR